MTSSWSELLGDLAGAPDELERAMRQVPADRIRWKPESWGGSPGETFTALEHVCHLRDIERDGYHLRIRRLLEETNPSLVSIDGDQLAKERRYHEADRDQALAAFRSARAETVERLRALEESQLDRDGFFEEYGPLTLRALVHYLRSHDQQHLAGIQWLAGKAASG